jgi:hypothetical protein
MVGTYKTHGTKMQNPAKVRGNANEFWHKPMSARKEEIARSDLGSLREDTMGMMEEHSANNGKIIVNK